MKNLQLTTLLCGGALALSLLLPLPSAQAQTRGQAATQMDATNALASTRWELISPNFAGLDKKPTIQFDRTRLNASVGLNRLNGDYKLSGINMTVSLLASTRMAGPPALMSAESRYAAALQNVRNYDISGDGKTLSLRGAQILRFRRVGQTLNDPLASTQWQLLSPNYAGLTEAPTLQWSENRLNASVGLNQINGEYNVSGRKLTISPLATTRKAGPPALMNAESRYKAALQKADSYELSRDGKTLTLRGEGTLKFGRVAQVANDVLASTQWKLTAPTFAGLDERPTLRFEDGRAGASVGLNQIGAQYRTSGKTILFDKMLSTQMAGSPAQMTAESRYARALASARTYELSRDGKILTLRGSQVLTFERAGQTLADPLASTQWKLSAPTYDGLTEKPTLQFGDGRLNASAGLNQINGSYTLNGLALTISPLASTRMAGPPALMNAETNYSKALQTVRNYELSADGQTLILRGDETLTFERADALAAENPLAFTEWELVTPSYAGLDEKPTITFADENMSASVGLNALGAGYKIGERSLKLEQFISTMMAGPPAQMKAENDHKKALAGTSIYKISDDGQTLTLSRNSYVISGDGKTLDVSGNQSLTFRLKNRASQGFVKTETKILNVEPQLGAAFDGDQTPKYLQLEDLSEGTSWGRFTQASIAGFDFQPGNRYQLRVAVDRDTLTGPKQLRLLEVLGQKYMATPILGAGEKLFEIAPTKVDCVGVVPMKCLQVREVSGEWGNFYAPIEGFDFVEGFRYGLQIKVSEIADPPADASNLRYELVRVLEKIPVTF